MITRDEAKSKVSQYNISDVLFEIERCIRAVAQEGKTSHTVRDYECYGFKNQVIEELKKFGYTIELTDEYIQGSFSVIFS